MKNNKVPGTDKILNEYLKPSPPVLVRIYCKLSKIVLDTGIIPDEAIHMPIFLFDTYRLLQVLSVIMSANPVWLINQIKWFLIQFTWLRNTNHNIII